MDCVIELSVMDKKEKCGQHLGDKQRGSKEGPAGANRKVQPRETVMGAGPGYWRGLRLAQGGPGASAPCLQEAAGSHCDP